VTFGAGAKIWFARIKSQRKGAEVESDVRREFLQPWRARSITDITTLDVARPRSLSPI
jgi:hypothetical protein